MKLYILLILLTIIFPLLLSFDKKVQFYRQFKPLFLAISIIGGFFIIWDIWFTSMAIWGFNDEHLLGINIGNLPLEEVLFFVVVPYACLFIHNVFSTYWPIKENISSAKNFTYLWVFGSIVLAVMYYDHFYTVSATFLSALTGLILLNNSNEYISNVWRSFLIVIIPFFIINGALTGAFTDAPVVWYNDLHNMCIRLITIPLDDIFYNFTLIVGIILLRDYFQIKFEKLTS
ncbi:MAG: lycopene cyclase domain-containing protein [Crocinitomicaceae bacterium]